MDTPELITATEEKLLELEVIKEAAKDVISEYSKPNAASMIVGKDLFLALQNLKELLPNE